MYRGRATGSFGDVACFSFYPTKNLGALGDGGMVVTNDPTLAAALREIREYGWRERYVSARIGINSRIDAIQRQSSESSSGASRLTMRGGRPSQTVTTRVSQVCPWGFRHDVPTRPMSSTNMSSGSPSAMGSATGCAPQGLAPGFTIRFRSTNSRLIAADSLPVRRGSA